MAYSVEALAPIYARLGIGLRKHTGRFPAWTARENTVVDLDAEERRVLEQEGEEALDARLRAAGMFPVPALDLRSLKALRRHTCLGHCEGVPATIYVPPASHLRALARELRQAISERACRPPEWVEAEEFHLRQLRRGHAIVLGGAHESAAAALLCDRYWLDADLGVPGPGGWLLRTVHNPAGLGHNVVHLCADETTAYPALEALLASLETSPHGCVGVGPLMEVHPGPELRRRLGRFEEQWDGFIALASRSLTPEHLAQAPTDPDDLEGFMDWLAAGYDSGGPAGDRYNRGPMTVAMRAARLYLLSGDRRYLGLFKGLVWRLIEYHCNFPGGASYLADYDFEVHSLALYWDLLEEQPCFDDDERLVISNFLLASLRMVDGYRQQNWPTQPGELRHNHETFPALSLHFGGRYFADYYRLPEAESWLETARETFSGPIETACKHLEDANLYQWLVPLHKLVYDSATGADTYLRNGVLEAVVENVLATTDNFGWPSDFGDADRPVGGGLLPATLLEYAAGRWRDPGLQWHAERIAGAIAGQRMMLPGFLGELFGNRRIEPGDPPEPPAVTVVPLDDHIRQASAPNFPARYTFDKVALRGGWEPEAEYLLVDGYSLGSHFHYDQNAIIRFAARGRLWLVDNGYGKPSGEARAGIAFSSRQRGPQDHNTLLVYTDEGQLALPAPFSALLASVCAGPLTLVQTAQVGYGPVDWLRSIVWLRGQFFVVVDQVQVMAPVHELRCQLNMLGAARLEPGVLICEQRGARLFLHVEQDSEVVLGSYSNASWDGVFAAGDYPYAAPPVTKFERVRRPQVGESVLFATLLYAGQERPAWELEIGAQTVAVTGHILGAEVALSGHGVAVAMSAGELTVHLTEPWPVPDDIPLLRATQDARRYVPLEEWSR